MRTGGCPEGPSTVLVDSSGHSGQFCQRLPGRMGTGKGSRLHKEEGHLVGRQPPVCKQIGRGEVPSEQVSSCPGAGGRGRGNGGSGGPKISNFLPQTA